ncbi:MAG TPA: putative quinol monooxygenase [Actinomycetota bacterium]
MCVRIEVIPEQVDAFLDATFTHARATRQEPGNVRFDVLQHNEDPSRFCLYEAYRDRESFQAHQQSPHYLTWRPTVAPFMAAPRVGDQYRSLFPDPWE